MCTIDVPRKPFSTRTSMNMNGKRRIGALSTRQIGLFAADAPSKSGGSSSSSSYLSSLLQSRTRSGTLAGRINSTSKNLNGNDNGSLLSTWDRRPKASTSLLSATLRDGRLAAHGGGGTSTKTQHGENRPTGSRRMQKRPHKPTDAYQYFFREQCRELSKMENSDGGGTFDMSSASSNKRRKSPTGEAMHLKIDIGKIVAKQWRELMPAQRQKYEDLAEKDAERYRAEVEEYYLQPNVQGAAAGVGAPSGLAQASTGRLAAIMAASSASRASNKLLMGNGGSNNNDNNTAPTAVNNALSISFTNSNSTTLSTNKTSLQSLLHERRTQLLDDLSSLNQITSSRLSAGRSALAGPVDPAVRQRLYHLSVGPGSGAGSSGSSAIGLSPWGSATRSSNTASASSTFTAGRMPTIFSPKKSSPAIAAAADGPTIEILN